MKEKNKKFNVELHITIKSYLNDFKDLFLLSSTKEIFNKKYSFSQQQKDLYIISYLNNNINNQILPNIPKQIIEIISFQKLKELIKLYPTLKIISYIKYDQNKNSFSLCNSFKYLKEQNIYKPENCERIFKLLPQQELNLIYQGDIIKLGYISLKFDLIFFSNNGNDINNNNLYSNGNINIIQEKNASFSSKYNSKENEKFCRICFQKGIKSLQGNNDSEIDPLISVCKCRDSMKYVHLSCLKNKINLNIYKKHYKHHDIYLFQNYNCEICLSTYPKYIIIDNKKISLLDLDISNYDNYAICDMIKYDDKNQYFFRIGYLVLHFENNVIIKVGRKKENDVIFNDLSISGNHCELITENNNLYLKDVGSSYGCLKYVQNDYEINEENELAKNDIFISGNNKFEINSVKNETFFNYNCFNILRNLFFDNKCCSNSSNDKGDVDVINNLKEEDINDYNKIIDENKTGNSKFKYFEKFEDCDSYNDYIINIDNDKIFNF